MRFLNGIDLLLLVLVQQRPDLRQRAVHHHFHFLHRLLMNGGDLRFGLIKDRLNLSLLVRCQVQLVTQMLQAECVPVPASSASLPRLCLHNGKTAECNRTGGDNC